MLLLDEPTSGLDAASERAVMRALEQAARGRTVVAVSHRLALARDADRMVVLEAVRVVEQGPPSSLLEDGGPFARMWALQRPAERRQGLSTERREAPPTDRWEAATASMERR